MTLRSNRVWQEHEKYQLWLAYNNRVSYDLMENYFKRTKQSLNKFLSRSGIRRIVHEIGAQRNPNLKIKEADELEKMFIDYGLDNITIGLEREHTRNWRPSQFTKSKLKETGITLPCPWGKTPKLLNLPKMSEIGRSSFRRTWVFSSMEAAINTLKRKGYSITAYPHENPYDYTYLLNQERVTDFQVLLKANEIRHKNGKPIFLVKGVTYEF